VKMIKKYFLIVVLLMLDVLALGLAFTPFHPNSAHVRNAYSEYLRSKATNSYEIYKEAVRRENGMVWLIQIGSLGVFFAIAVIIGRIASRQAHDREIETGSH
jgi:hypothetical protein